MSISSTKTNGNLYSTLYLNNDVGSAKVWYNNDLGMSLTTSGPVIRISPGNNEAVVIDALKTVDFKGAVKNKLALSNNFATNGVSHMLIENKASTGYAQLKIETPSEKAYLQTGINSGLLLATETSLPLRFSPNKTEAFRLDASGNAVFQKDVQINGNFSFKGNIWIQKQWDKRNPSDTGLYYHPQQSFEAVERKRWRKIPMWKAGAIPTRGQEPAVAGSWFDSTNEHFHIRKDGVYNFKNPSGHQL